MLDLRPGPPDRLTTLAFLLLVALFASPWTLFAQVGGGQSAPQDPDVKALAQVLRRPHDPDRAASIKERTDALRTLGQIGDALQLQEWNYDSIDADTAAIDRKAWDSLAGRFEKKARAALASPDALVGRAMAELIAELANKEQKPESKSKRLQDYMAEHLTEPLVQRIAAPGPKARIAAAEALASLKPGTVKFTTQSLDALKTAGLPKALLEKLDKLKDKEFTSDAAVFEAFRNMLLDTTLTDDEFGELQRSRVDVLDSLARPGVQTVQESLSRLLTQGDAAERRGACDALALYIRAVLSLDKQSTLEEPRVAISKATAAAVTTVTPGLKDSDPAVRRLAVIVLKEGAQSLSEVIRPLNTNLPFFLGGLTQEQRREIKEYALEVQEESRLLRPLLTALRDQCRTVAALTDDPHRLTGLAARDVFELLALARLKLKERRDSVPMPGPDKPDVKDKGKDANQGPRLDLHASAVPGPFLVAQADEKLPPPRPIGNGAEILMEGLRPVLPVIAAGLSHHDLQVRLKSANTIELLGKDAITPDVITALLKAVQQDPNVFVRWASVRILGKMELVSQAATIVPAIAEQLCATDIDLRKAAATALGAHGPAAAAAVPQLGKAAITGDSDGRLAAIQALRSIGRASVAAVPQLIIALRTETRILEGSSAPRADDAKVRQAAAELLGYLGPAAAAAVPALEAALDDTDPDVRRAVSAALVSIMMPGD